MKTLIHENELGLLFKKGKLIRVLSAGSYHFFGSSSVELIKADAHNGIVSAYASLSSILALPGVKETVTELSVLPGQTAVHFVDGIYTGWLGQGKYAFPNSVGEHTFTVLSDDDAEFPEDLPVSIRASLPGVLTFPVPHYAVGLVYVDGKFTRFAEEGTHYFPKSNHKVIVSCANTRMVSLPVTGQELLSADKVTLRVNMMLYARITDPVAAYEKNGTPTEYVHDCAQLVLREEIGKRTVDTLLADKTELVAAITESLRERIEGTFVELGDIGIKDIILPGEVRQIMNTVLIAEKQAQANVITRREEVASTRSLLNTAKLLDENDTLHELKRLEYLQKICESIGSVNVGAGDLLSTLEKLVSGDKKD